MKWLCLLGGVVYAAWLVNMNNYFLYGTVYMMRCDAMCEVTILLFSVSCIMHSDHTVVCLLCWGVEQRDHVVWCICVMCFYIFVTEQ